MDATANHGNGSSRHGANNHQITSRRLGKLGVSSFLSRISLTSHLMLGLIVRLCLIVFGAFQDRKLDVKYTDIDYHVFSDAAQHVTRGGSPFLRDTYRYTPLLAYIMTPNELFGRFFGKILFCFSDLLVAFLQYRMLRPIIGNRLATMSCLLWLYHPLVINISTRGNAESIMALLTTATLYALVADQIWLSALFFGLCVHFKLYPICFAPALILFISRRHHLPTEYFWRGSTALSQINGNIGNGIRHGADDEHAGADEDRPSQSSSHRLSTPVRGAGDAGSNPRFAAHNLHVFSPLTRPSVHKRNNNRSQASSTADNESVASMPVSTASQSSKTDKNFLSQRFSKLLPRFGPTFKQVEFTAVAVTTFTVCTALFYMLYGMQFLNESILYHFSRKDTQHNFSYWFYILRMLNNGIVTTTKPLSLFGRIVLFPASLIQLSIGLLGFIPQVLVCAWLNWKFRSSPMHAAFFCTFAFVALNKVCTVQYFVWYLTFLPFVYVSLDLPMWSQLAVIAQWCAALGHWLWQAYKYEFLKQHENLFRVWLGSLLMLAANVVVFAVLYSSVKRCRRLAIAYNDAEQSKLHAATKKQQRLANGSTQREAKSNDDDYMDENGLLEGAAETMPYLVAQKWAEMFKADLPATNSTAGSKKI